jgi:hypothetical protein
MYMLKLRVPMQICSVASVVTTAVYANCLIGLLAQLQAITQPAALKL